MAQQEKPEKIESVRARWMIRWWNLRSAWSRWEWRLYAWAALTLLALILFEIGEFRDRVDLIARYL